MAWLATAWAHVRGWLAVAVFGVAVGVVAILLWLLHGTRKRAVRLREQRDIARAKGEAAERARQVYMAADQAAEAVVQGAAKQPPPDTEARDDFETRK